MLLVSRLDGLLSGAAVVFPAGAILAESSLFQLIIIEILLSFGEDDYDDGDEDDGDDGDLIVSRDIFEFSSLERLFRWSNTLLVKRPIELDKEGPEDIGPRWLSPSIHLFAPSFAPLPRSRFALLPRLSPLLTWSLQHPPSLLPATPYPIHHFLPSPLFPFSSSLSRYPPPRGKEERDCGGGAKERLGERDAGVIPSNSTRARF